ncbi:MAG: DivIVA domain-containing protein [Pseudonocardia sp.]|nr:DivIVA domain-containing protein [Pseudonocardia sp.]
MPLTPADVHNVAFSKPPIGKRGYNEDEVDAFLDLVEAELARLIEENEDLREQVSELEQRLGNAQADLEEVRSRPPAVMPAPVSPPTQQIQRPVEPPPPMRPPMEPQRSMSERSMSAPPPQLAGTGDQGGDHHVQVAKVLSMAQEMAERLTAEAKSEADAMLGDARTKSEQLLSEARTKSDGLVNDARARAETMLNDARTRAETLERQSRDKAATLVGDAERKQNEIIGSITREKTVLEKKIDELRTFEREYRTRLKTYLESQLRDLEGRGSAAPTDGRSAREGGYAATGYGQRADAGS